MPIPPSSVTNRFSGPALAGMLMIYAAVCVVLYMIVKYDTFIDPIALLGKNKEASDIALVSVVLTPVGLLLFCFFTFILGYRLISSSGVTLDYALSSQDRDLLTGLIKGLLAA
jgi:hypothetical protein